MVGLGSGFGGVSLFLILFVCDLLIGSEDGDQFRRSRNEIEDYARAVNVLREYFAREVIQKDVEDPQEKSQEKSQENSPRSRNSEVGAKFSRRTLEPGAKVPLIKDRKDPTKTKRYLNEWVVHMSGGEVSARRIVKELGYDFHGPVKGFQDMYRVSHRLQHHDHKRETEEITRHISSHIEVLWAEQQISRPRYKRSIEPKEKQDKSIRGLQDTPTNRLQMIRENTVEKKSVKWVRYLRDQENMFNDPLWKHQWYLFDSRTREDLPELDLKIIPVWNSGITGKGVKVVIVDDGLEWNHTDLIKNYDAEISYDLNDDDIDPTPRYDELRTNSHGTKCAGEVAMQPNNEKCGVGVAYGSSIGGIRMLDGNVSDRTEGTALAIGRDTVDIMSCSWGPADDGITVEGPGKLTQMSLERGVKEGRNGKGIIYVWASGNGGLASDNCNCDGYVSSIYTISVSTASENGKSPWYSEHCSSTLTSTYSSGAYSDQKIATTDIENDCTVSFSGTSASAPLAAGIIALALEANPSMTWRDIQHAIVRASDWTLMSRDKGWQTNGAGFHFNIKFGFGLLLAEPMVNTARNWTSVPNKRICRTDADIESMIVIESGGSYDIEITPLCTSPNEIRYLEYVEILLSLTHSKRGVLKISLTSPQGTTTSLLNPRPSDDSTDGFFNWPLTSVHTWGEDPTGTWKLVINDTSTSGQHGAIISASLILHGIEEPIP